MNDIDKLKAELHQISLHIYAIKEIIENEANLEKKKQLEKSIKQLQFQALFYIEKIENLEDQNE